MGIDFKLFVIFLLATTGLAFITNRSGLFKPIRTWITDQHVYLENKKLIAQKKVYGILFWWWLDEIFSCYMCMSVYTGSMMALLSYLSLSSPWIIYIMYPFAAVPVVCIVIQHWVKTEKK